MKIKSYLYSGVLYLICLLHLTFCTGCEEIFKPNNESKYGHENEASNGVNVGRR